MKSPRILPRGSAGEDAQTWLKVQASVRSMRFRRVFSQYSVRAEGGGVRPPHGHLIEIAGEFLRSRPFSIVSRRAGRFVVHPPKRWAWRMYPMRYESGRIIVTVPEPSSERERASYPPIMRCWTIERFPERRPPQRHFWYSDGKRIWTSIPWLMRDP